MSQASRKPLPLDAGEEVYSSLRKVRLVAGLIVLGMVLVTLAAGVGIVIRLARPVGGGVALVIVVAAAAVVSLASGALLLELAARKAHRADSLRLAAEAYQSGSALAGTINLLAGCLTVGSIFSSGLSGGLWLPKLLVLGMNLVGMAICIPRLRRLRELHYRPTLPYTRA